MVSYLWIPTTIEIALSISGGPRNCFHGVRNLKVSFIYCYIIPIWSDSGRVGKIYLPTLLEKPPTGADPRIYSNIVVIFGCSIS
ncbi:hypothetical protein HanXRQr2_Chr14g0662281 [Helianthus annuus]|uniref:Uncharacterized protein n=1 Tax=Helianthus annuus TaxID=4232 RepID=A0A9K3ECI9_HELAN|nr:hypothetical protein HanXRQr2_Chr14g0662281 [Helianthus annuus]KAJ0841892.1 hypothetical protein HanPSC8_Chr14g0635551 [Helianthus annuus]